MASGKGQPAALPPSNRAFSAVALRFPLLVIIWGALSEGEGWIPGLIASAVLAPASLWLVSPMPNRTQTLWGLFRLIPLFAKESLLGGWDVATRALSVQRTVRPRMELVRLETPGEAVATALAFAVTLMPGTLVVEVDRRRLLVHSIDYERDACASIANLERRLGRIFRGPR